MSDIIGMANELKKLDAKGKKGQFIRRKFIEQCLNMGAQYVHTPFSLCSEMIGKLKENAEKAGKSIKDLSIFVLCNVEFVETLVFDYGVNPQNIYFFADSKGEAIFVKRGYKVKVAYNGAGVNNTILDNLEKIVSANMKFDVIVGNPPYQAPKEMNGQKKGTIGGDLWSKFVEKSLDLVKDDGYVCLVHPSGWRKPEHRLYTTISGNKLLYLEIHGEEDGRKTFGAGTRYDWYVLQKGNSDGTKTEVKDQSGKTHEIDLSEWAFLPNKEFDLMLSILAKNNEPTCEVLYSRSAYGSDKKWMNEKQDDVFKYPCVYSLTQQGLGFWYSSVTDKGFFGTSKVVLSWGRHQYPVIDMAGDYGLTQNTFALKVDNKEEAENIVKAINSDKFKKLLVATKWGQFITEWRMFKYFRKDFWKSFI